MKRLTIWVAAGAMLACGALDSAAQDRGGRDGGNRDGRQMSRGDGQRVDSSRGDRANRGDHGNRDGRGWNRGNWRGGDRHHGRPWYEHRHYHGWRPWYGHRHYHGWRPWSNPRHYYRSSYPYWLYGAPLVPLFSYAGWEPPVYVERIIEREPVYVERGYTETRPYGERSYAQITPPPAPRPAEPPKPAPPPPARLERYTLSATELFEFDKSTLRMPQPKLDEIAAAMNRNPQIDKVTITGYTDRIGAVAYNMKLSRQRADAVRSYLIDKGVAATRLASVGKGEANPVVQCNEKVQAALIKCLEPNRRVEVEQITVERRVTR